MPDTTIRRSLLTTLAEDQIFASVAKAIMEATGCTMQQITMDADLIGDLAFDSLTVTELLMTLEEEFNIDLDQDNEITLRILGEGGSKPADSLKVKEIVKTILQEK